MRNSSSHGWPLCNRRGRPPTMRSRSSGCTRPGEVLPNSSRVSPSISRKLLLTWTTFSLPSRIQTPKGISSPMVRYRDSDSARAPRVWTRRAFSRAPLPHQVLALLFRALPFGHVAAMILAKPRTSPTSPRRGVITPVDQNRLPSLRTYQWSFSLRPVRRPAAFLAGASHWRCLRA